MVSSNSEWQKLKVTWYLLNAFHPAGLSSSPQTRREMSLEDILRNQFRRCPFQYEINRNTSESSHRLWRASEYRNSVQLAEGITTACEPQSWWGLWASCKPAGLSLMPADPTVIGQHIVLRSQDRVWQLLIVPWLRLKGNFLYHPLTYAERVSPIGTQLPTWQIPTILPMHCLCVSRHSFLPSNRSPSRALIYCIF